MKKRVTLRTTSFILTMVILMGILIACNSNSSAGGNMSPHPKDENSKSDKVVNVEFWNPFGGADGETMVKITDEFNKTHPNIKIKPVTQDSAQYYAKLKTSIMAGTAPDLAISHDISAWDLIRTGVIIPLEDQAIKLGVNIEYPTYIEKINQLKYDGKIYAVPLDGVMLLMYYNKDLLSKAGLLNSDGTPNIGKGLDGLIQAFETVKKNVPGVSPLITTTGATTPVFLLNTIYYSNGGGSNPLVSNDGKKFDINDQVMLTTLGIMKKLHSYSMPSVANATEYFTSGKAAFMIEGTYQMNALSQGLKDKLGVISIPQFGSEYKVPVYSHTFVLPKKDKRNDETTKAALEFVKWFGEGDHNVMWASAGHMPGNTRAVQTDAFKALPYHKYYADEVTHPSPLEFGTPFNIKVAPELLEPLAKLAKGEANEQQTLDDMKKRMATSLNK